jgi:hypothetical protein
MATLLVQVHVDVAPLPTATKLRRQLPVLVVTPTQQQKATRPAVTPYL